MVVRFVHVSSCVTVCTNHYAVIHCSFNFLILVGSEMGSILRLSVIDQFAIAIRVDVRGIQKYYRTSDTSDQAK